MTEITALYLQPPAEVTVLSIDEKTGMQALERRFPDRPPAPGRPRRREFEYTRHGTRCSARFDVHRGHVTPASGPTRTAVDLIGFMEHLAAQYPTGPAQVSWDTLNIPFDGAEPRCGGWI